MQRSDLHDNAPSSETLWADVMATRKMVFNLTHFKPTSAMGSNGVFIRPWSTVWRLQVGNLWFVLGFSAVAPLRNLCTNGCWDNDGVWSGECKENMESNAETCRRRVAGRRLFQMPLGEIVAPLPVGPSEGRAGVKDTMLRRFSTLSYRFESWSPVVRTTV